MNFFSESSRLLKPKRYATAAAFRRALEGRLQDMPGSLEETTGYLSAQLYPFLARVPFAWQDQSR
jgi:hypothetical protein